MIVTNLRKTQCEIYSQDTILTSILKKGCSIYQFLDTLNIDDLINNIDKLYIRKPRYQTKGMLMLAIGYHFHSKSYEKFLSKIEKNDFKLLNFKNKTLP